MFFFSLLKNTVTTSSVYFFKYIYIYIYYRTNNVSHAIRYVGKPIDNYTEVFDVICIPILEGQQATWYIHHYKNNLAKSWLNGLG